MVRSGADANTWTFVQRQAGNMLQTLERLFPGSRIVGPIVQGLDLPVNSLPPSSNVSMIVDLAAAVAMLSAKEKAPGAPGA
jgi:phosphotransacetylase